MSIRSSSGGSVVDLSVRLLAGLVHDEGGTPVLRRILPQALPWVAFLPKGGADELLEELVATLRAVISIDDLWPVSQVLVEWRHTAEIHADPHLHAEAKRQLGEDDGPVRPPEASEHKG